MIHEMFCCQCPRCLSKRDRFDRFRDWTDAWFDAQIAERIEPRQYEATPIVSAACLAEAVTVARWFKRITSALRQALKSTTN
jgi:hypothetical protein